MTKNLEIGDALNDLGRAYIIILLITGALFAFIAITNFNDLLLFKLAMSYSVLLIFGFLGILADRNKENLGIDSVTWDSSKLKYQIGIGAMFIVGWYLLFMKGGLAMATPQSVGVSFSTNPTLDWFITGVLAPLAEDCFFFGVLNITMIYIVRQLQREPTKAIIVAVMLLGSYFLLTNVPNVLMFLGLSAGSIVMGAYVKSPKLKNIAAVVAAAAFIGGAIFPKYHSYAYQLNESNYIAASYFGFIFSLMVGFVGLLPVDMAHIFNNIMVQG